MAERQLIGKKLDSLPVYDLVKIELYEEWEKINKQLTDWIQPSPAKKKVLLARKKEIERLEEYKEVSLYKHSIEDIIRCTKEKDYMDHFVDHEIQRRCQFLEDNGYFSDQQQLTQKGLTSLYFKELNTIVGTEIVFSDACCSMDERRWITLLVLITETGGSEFFETPYPDVTQYLESKFNLFLNRKDVHPVLDWYQHKHITEIIKEYNIFEGDLIKTIQRILHYMDEFKDAYVHVNKLNIVTMLTNIQKNLEREIVSTESLYLKI